MNSGAFGENFPYSNFHDLNMDWIIKIAKDFLDQYSHIQETITNGLEALDEKASNLEALLQEWYDTHSADIANQLAEALEDLNTWYTTHQNYLDQTLTAKTQEFNTLADRKTAESIASIPDDYTTLSNNVTALMQGVGITPITFTPNSAIFLRTSPVNTTPQADALFECAIVPCTPGQAFTVNADGGASPRAWGFIDSDNNIISVANDSITVKNLVLYAPENATHLVINNRMSSANTSYIGQTISNHENLQLIIGTIYYGLEQESTALARTPFIMVYPGDILKIGNSFRARISYYNPDGTFNSQSQFYTSDIQFNDTRLIRLTTGYTDERTLTTGMLPTVQTNVYINRNNNYTAIKYATSYDRYYRRNAIVYNALGGAIKRIPFCDFTNNGVLIVGCDNRIESGADLSPIDICITRSFNLGETFEHPITVLSRTPGGTNYRVMDGAILVNRTTNRVFVFGHRINEETAWETTHSGNYNGYPVYKYSDDDGKTWSAEVSLAGLKTADMVTLFDGVGKGITLNNGTLVMPMQAKMKTDNTSETGTMFNIQSCIAYSTDNGSTWILSNLVPCYSSECQVVELPDGSIMLNARGYISKRRVFITRDLGQTWEPHESDKTIIEPTGCQGCLSKLTIFGTDFYTFSNPHSTVDRSNLMVQYSHDATNWHEGMTILKHVSSGYSCTAYYNGRFVVATEEATINCYTFPVEYIKALT